MIDKFIAARQGGTPLIAITTPDPAATIGTIVRRYGKKDPKDQPPLIEWDIVRGLFPCNDTGAAALDKVLGSDNCPWESNEEATNLFAVLQFLGRNGLLPEKSIMFVHAFHRAIEVPEIVQAVWNIRDVWKRNTRTLVGLAPSLSLPPELAGDVYTIDEPLPDDAAIEGIVRSLIKGVNPKAEVDNPMVDKCVDACSGLSAFSAEQITAMSVTDVDPVVINTENLWSRKVIVINSTEGLYVNVSKQKFADVGGCENAKKFYRQLLTGKERYRVVVLIDEGEKMFAGSTEGTSDSSGTSQAFLGMLLTEMQERRYGGCIHFGPPGAAKTLMAKAVANEFGLILIMFNLSEMKNALVGRSEENLRAALKVLYAISQGKALFVMTVNRIDGLRPELRRRFKLPTFFYDLPTEAERALIWDLYMKKYNLEQQSLPDDDGWTGSEIEVCCETADLMSTSLIDASGYIVPVAQSAPKEIETVRTMASRKYVSASKPGLYTYSPSASGKRARERASDTETRRNIATKGDI